MKKINYHTHTQLCRHAGGTELDYAMAAVESGLDVLGFSEHAAFPDGRYGMRMMYPELEPYISVLNKLKKEFSLQLDIYSGLEIEYCPDMHAYYQSLLTPGRLDYLLLGQHFYCPDDSASVNIYQIEERKDTSIYIDYALSVRAGMETGFFRVLAHPDVIFINNLQWDENCEIACDIIIKAAQNTGTILEFNANGIRRGRQNYCDGERYPYPHPSFWCRLSGSGMPVLISSDCHTPSVLWDSCMDKAYQIAREWKLCLVDEVGLH